MTGAVCVVVHDVADRTWPSCRRLLAEIAAVAPVPVTLLAVPRYRGDAPSRALEEWLGAREDGGDELALHGWTHTDDRSPRDLADRLRRRVYTRGEGEFWDLDLDEARLRLQRGADWFDANGWRLRGFVAPAWLLGPAGWRALRMAPRFSYTATLRTLHVLAGEQRITAQSLVYSSQSAWRRVASLAWVGATAFAQRGAPLLRLELHPGDVEHAAIRRSWQGVLARALGEQGRHALTLGDAAQAWPPLVRAQGPEVRRS